jgi:uroporphyrinogen decarboxylase
MNSRERVLCALSGGQPDRVPYVESSVAANVARALAGGADHDLSEREISEMLGRDLLMPVMFPPYFADKEVGTDGQVYMTTGWIRTRDDLDKMVFPDPNDSDLYAECRKVLAERGDFAVAAAIKHGVAPMLVSMGLEGFSYALGDDPWLVEEVLRRYTDYQVVVNRNLCDLGFDFLWSFDDVAYKSGPFVSPRQFRQYFMPAFRRSVEAIRLPWIFHSDGDIMPVLNDLLTLGMNGLHPLEPGPMDLKTMKERVGERVCLVGNVSVDTLSAGTPEQVRAEVLHCLKIGGPGGGYMITSSNSVPCYALPENVRAMADAIREFGAYPI